MEIINEPRIYFTVSMWNRMKHFGQLLENLEEIWEHDKNIALHVAEFNQVKPARLRKMLLPMPFHTQFWQIDHEFCNGMGHNVCIQNIIDNNSILAIIAVDLMMPPTITSDIRRHTIPGETFYGPLVQYQCADGRRLPDGAAYALISVFKQDMDKAGRLAQNMMWGGNRREGGEDIMLMRRLKRIGLKQRRPRHEGLVCRWHTRNVDQTFYRSYNRYHQMPWWDLVRDDGTPLERKR